MYTFSQFKLNEKGKFQPFKNEMDLTLYLRQNGDDAPLLIDPSVGGGKGVFVEFAPSGKFVILNVKGQDQSYNIVNVGKGE